MYHDATDDCSNNFLSFIFTQFLGGQETSLPASVLAKQKALPEAVVYRVLLHQAAVFHDKAADLDREGGDGSPYRQHLAAKFGLTSQQVLQLDSVALQYREDVQPSEEQLRLSIQRFHDQLSKLPAGSRMPGPPSEARYLLYSRDAVTLNARDRFHALVGDQEFSRIDGIVKKHIAAGLEKNTGMPGADHAK